MFISKHKRVLGDLLLIAAFAIVAMLPAYFRGLPSGNDQSQHFQFAWTVYNSVREGDLYPGFASETNHGAGDYGIRFYPPLTYYSLSFVFLLLQDWYFASLVAFTLAFFIGGVGMYLWVKETADRPQALTAALIYTLAPYHLNQIYNNFLLAEFFAMAIVPFCILYVTRVCTRGRLIDVLGLTIAYSLLMLTHLPMTIIVSISMGIYALALLRRPDAVATVAKLGAAVILPVVMTSFYWSRWLPELAWIQHAGPKYFSGQWTYTENYLMLPDQLIHFSEDTLNLWLADLMLFAIVLISVPSVIYLFSKRPDRSRYVWATFGVLFFAAFMTTPLSAFIWNAAGFLQKIQFPWRWLAIVSVFGAAFASAGVARACLELKNSRNILFPLGLGAIFVFFVFMAVFITKSSVFIPRDQITYQMKTMSESESCECWWPIWARRTAFTQIGPIDSGGRPANITRWDAGDKAFHIDAGDPLSVSVRSFYYPRWQATVNGADVPVEASESGTVSVPVPAAASDVHLLFREPDYVQVANIASAAAWLLVLVLTAFLLLKSRRVLSQPAILT